MSQRKIVLCWITTTFLIVAGVCTQAQSLSGEQILERVRNAWQGESFHGIVSLDVALAGQTKSHQLEVWTQGEDRALILTLEPEEEAGSGYLQLGDELWYVSPGVGTVPLPTLAVADAVFGAGPSIQDLSRGTMSNDYAVEAEEREDDGFSLALTPYPDAPVVYGRLDIQVDGRFVVEQIVYYDQRGGVVQTATFSDVVDVGGRFFPTSIVIETTHGDRTIQRFRNPEFDVQFDPDFFTLDTLRQMGENR